MAKKKIKELLEQRKDILAQIDNAETVEVIDKLEVDLRKVDRKISEAEKEVDENEPNENVDERTAAINGNIPDGVEKRGSDYIPGVGFRKVDGTDMENKDVSKRKVGNEVVSEKELEKRGAIWKGNDTETRTVVLDSSILIPEHQSSEIKRMPFNEVSSILDLIKITPFTNGESYDVPFEYETGMAAYTSEPNADGTGGEYNEVEVKFDSARIKKAFVTAYAEISKQFLKTPSTNYAERVQANITTSVRKKLARDIIIGAGGENAIQGILTQPAKVTKPDGKEGTNMTIDTDLSIATLDANTITDVVFNFGGENDVEDGQVLVMNKLTLNDLAKLRDGNGNRVYDIKTAGSTFTIDGIRGIFSAHIKPFSKAGESDYYMAYGSPKAYELALFSALEVEQSTDYKFKQGITAYRGDEFVGGNLTAYKSWIRVKKGTATLSADKE